MYNTAFLKKFFILCTFFILCSCDKDYNIVGENLIGDNNFDLGKYYSSVKAYNQKTGAVQSDNLPINALGVFTNTPFGTTTASFVTQVSLATTSPTFGNNVVLESVVLNVPYISTLKSTADTGIKTYKLDSIYGTPSVPFKLSIYESGYFIRNLDPSPTSSLKDRQAYYSDQKDDFDNLKIGNRLNDSPEPKENDSFFFDPTEIVQETTDAETQKVTTVRSAPAMHLKLNKKFFEDKIIKAPAGKLLSNETFNDYFRGLYFKVEKKDEDASLAQIDFSKGTIILYYKEDSTTTTNGITTTKQVSKTLTLNLKGNTVNFLEQSNPSTDYSNTITNPNTTIGDSKLYLKGGEGALAVIELFGADADNNGVADELETIRTKGWLINEANLVFHIDAPAMANSVDPNRIYVYNLTNKTAVLDYLTDNTSGSVLKNNKYIFDGILKKDATTKKGTTYKVRITNHIKNLIKNKDTTNVKLGVVVTEDIAISAFNKVKTAKTLFNTVPRASILNPLGTILYGGNALIPEDKRLRLEIIYTQPK